MTDTIMKSEADPVWDILKQDVLGRVTTPKARREALLDEFEKSAMSGREFARFVGINYQTFAVWIQGRRRQRGDYARLRVAKANKKPLRKALFVEAMVNLDGTLQQESKAASSGIKLKMPFGIEVALENREQLPLLKELLILIKSTEGAESQC